MRCRARAICKNSCCGAALGVETLPIEKIERDGDKVLGGRRFLFLSNNQPKDGVRDGGEVLGRVRAGGRTRGGGGVLSSFGAMA